MTDLLTMTGIVKEFPGVRALDGVDLDLRAGEVHCLLGQNGAGKSTLIKVLAGVHPLQHGTITVAGAPLVTADGGRTWRESTSRWPYSLGWAAAVSDGFAFALVDTRREQRLVRTTDAGRTWRVVHHWPKSH
jgi:ABC-type taurine transport system ATPase subunit